MVNMKEIFRTVLNTEKELSSIKMTFALSKNGKMVHSFIKKNFDLDTFEFINFESIK